LKLLALAFALVLTAINPAFANSSPVWIGDYGAICDGTTDDTAAIQAAWNAAQAQGVNVDLSGVGPVCKISGLVAPAVVQRGFGTLPPVASMLVGDGMNTVELLSTVTGTSCAITLSESFESFQPAGTMGGFALVQASNVQPSAGGYGLCLNSVTELNVDGVFIRGFAHGIHAVDTVNLHIDGSILYLNDWHIFGGRGTHSYPNSWTIENSRFGIANQYGIVLWHPDQVNILHDTFEANGKDLTLQPATIYVLGNAVDGSFGLNVRGDYFEYDGGASIALQSLSGAEINSVTHDISDNTFVRRSASTTNIIVTNQDATHKIVVNVEANGFMDTVPGLGGTYIAASSPLATNYQIYCRANNYTNPAAMPSPKCLYPGANAAFAMDASGINGGP
jgi:hypothetical protein